MSFRIANTGGAAAPLGPAARDTGADDGFVGSLESLLQPRAPPKPAAPPPASPGGLRFSRHAQGRLNSRGVELPQEDLERLGAAIDQLGDRGARESLVLLGDNAFVVGVPQRTVITVMPRSEAMGTIFTNIDSTFVAS